MAPRPFPQPVRRTLPGAFPSTLPGSLRGAVLTALLLTVLATAAPAGATLVPAGPLVEVTAPASGYTAAELAPLADHQPHVVMDAEGGFLVFWHAAGRGSVEAPTIFARRFAADGTPMWAPRPIWDAENDIGVVRGLDEVAMNGAGDYVVAWIGADGVALRAFDVCGDPLGPVIEVGGGSVADGEVVLGARALGVAVTEDRQLLVALAQILDNPEDPGVETFDRVVVRRYDVDGNLLGPQLVSTASARVTDISVATADGTFAVASQIAGAQPERPAVVLETYTTDGERLVTPPSPAEHPLERSPRVAMDAGGSILLALEDGGGAGDGVDGSCSGVFARVYGGTALGEETRVNPRAEGCQGQPRAAGMAEGWVVGWRGADALPQRSVDGSDHGLYVRRYAGDGTASGGAVRVLPGYAGGFDVAGGGDGAVVAATLGGGPRLVAQPLRPAGETTCGDGSTCFQDGRFRVHVDWRNPYDPGVGPARAYDVPAADSEAFWFFRQDNLELLVKVLDGRGTNGHFWVFYGSLSTVEFWLTVTDTLTGRQQVYYNPPFEQPSRADTAAFPADAAAADGGAVAPTALAAGAGLGGDAAAAGVLQVPATSLVPATGALTPPLCGTTAEQLCLGDAFAVTVTWKDPRTGNEGVGGTIPMTRDTGGFWFFRESNAELMVKVLDGRSVNGHWWVFHAGLSDVEYTLTVEPVGGEPVVYTNPPFTLGTGADTTAFDEEEGP